MSSSDLIRRTSKAHLTKETQGPPTPDETVGGIPKSSGKGAEFSSGLSCELSASLSFDFLFFSSRDLKSLCHSDSWHCCGDQRRFVQTPCSLRSLKMVTEKWHKGALTLPKSKTIQARRERRKAPCHPP